MISIRGMPTGVKAVGELCGTRVRKWNTPRRSADTSDGAFLVRIVSPGVYASCGLRREHRRLMR